MDWTKIMIRPDQSLINTIKVIESGSKGTALVLNENGVFLGTVTDGDIRRGILNGHGLNDEISKVMNSTPLSVRPGDILDDVLEQAKALKIRILPQIDLEGKILKVHVVDPFLKDSYSNPVIIMAGGLGTRLGDLTKTCPKPMLKIGQRPILETIIKVLKSYGLTDVFISVNYLSEVIQDYFEDGKDFGVNINYIKETKRLGTAGSLSLYREKYEDDKTTIVLNGDLLTKINFQNLLEFHEESNCMATICVKQYDMEIPYGVLDIDNGMVSAFNEKPLHSFFVNAGSYAFSPKAFDLIPYGEYFDMNDFFNVLIKNKIKTTAYPVSEYWIDVGQQEDFRKAQSEFIKEFN